MPDYAELTRIIYRYGNYQSEGRQAVKSLVEGGEPAFDVFQSMRQHPPASEIHGRDLAETITDVIGEFAATIPDVVFDRFESGELGAFETYWALGMAQDDRSIDVLIGGLKHKDKWCRWAAAESLIRRKSKRATDALLESLKDRSSYVKSTVVSAMKQRKSLRRPKALLALQKIVSSQANRRHSPGVVECAEEVIRLIQMEN